MLSLFATIGQVITTGFNRWGEVKEAKHQATLARIKATANIEQIKAQHLSTWQATMAEATKSSWKDQYALIILSIPAILAFVPWAVPYVTAGFGALATMPGWYQTCFITAVMASFGIRVVPHVAQIFKGKKQNKS